MMVWSAFRFALGQDLPVDGCEASRAARVRLRAPEVLQEVVTAAGQDALGVELDALDGVLAVPDAHDRTVFGAAGDEQAFWDRFWLDHERMVACSLEALAGLCRPRGRRALSSPSCRGRARRALPRRRKPARWTGVRGRRPEWGCSHRPPLDQLHRDPASFGVQGPGETTILSGWSAETSSGVTSSLRRTRTSAPSSRDTGPGCR